MATTALRSRQLKRLFLEHFAEYGNITMAARTVGIARQTVYDWQEHDDGFATAFRDAEIQSTEVLEAEARRRAYQGVERLKFDRGVAVLDPDTGLPYLEHEYSDTLMIFLLKARNPVKYRENTRIEHTGADGRPIQVEQDVNLSLTNDQRVARIAHLFKSQQAEAARSLSEPESDMDAPGGAPG